jgi:hypothetical protein
LASKKLIFKSQNSVNSFSQLKRGEVSIKEIADEEKPKNSNRNWLIILNNKNYNLKFMTTISPDMEKKPSI